MTSDLWTIEQLVAERYILDNTQYNRPTSITLAGFEPTTSAGERPQTYILDRTANGTGEDQIYGTVILFFQCGCEIRPLTLREESRLRGFES
jgi:hypothetical protein